MAPGPTSTSPLLIKIGGRAAERGESLASLAAEMATLSRDNRLILVHGGGAEVTALSRTLGMEPVFKDGVRQTSPEEMDVVEMVLAGRINKRLVRLLKMRGLRPVGLSGSDGGIFTGAALGGSEESRTGDVTAVNPGLLELLTSNGYVPVLCPTSMDGEGRALNINADTVAFRLAAGLRASALVFLSDIPGVLLDGGVAQALSSAEARGLITRGVITGGMVAKVAASLEAIDQGVQKVIIGQYEGPGSLARLLEGKQGTRLWK